MTRQVSDQELGLWKAMATGPRVLREGAIAKGLIPLSVPRGTEASTGSLDPRVTRARKGNGYVVEAKLGGLEVLVLSGNGPIFWGSVH